MCIMTHSNPEVPFTRMSSGETLEHNLDEGPLDIRLGTDTPLRIVDPRRDLTIDQAQSQRENQRVKLNTSIEAFIIAPDDLDVRTRKGYKALRDNEQVEIGRSSPGRFSLGEFVSRHHVRIILDGQYVYVTDLLSTNGTFYKKPLIEATPKDIEFSKTEEVTPGHTGERIYPDEVTNGGFTAASERHPGYNDDAWFAHSESLSYGVFDGVGGLPGSALASKVAAETIETILSSMPTDTPASLVGLQLTEALQAAHHAIIERDAGTIETTATIAKLFVNEHGATQVAIASAGDSRVYMLREGELKMLTLDHGIAIGGNDQERYALQHTLSSAVDLSKLSADEREVFRRRNVITSALGGSDHTLVIASTIVDTKPGDKLLLTTDGIHDNLTTSEIKHWVERSATDDILTRRLVSAAQDRSRDSEHVRSKKDDMTAVLVSIK